jgi:competence protein ComEC
MAFISEQLKKTPFFKLVVPFIIGIISHNILKPELKICQLLFALAVVFFIILTVFKYFRSYHVNYLWGIIITLLFFASGLFLTSIKTEKNKIPPGLFHSETISVTVYDLPVYEKNKWKGYAEISAFKEKKLWKSCKSLSKINIYCDSSKFRITAGDHLLITNKVEYLPEVITPLQFDNKKYLYYKEIQVQINTKSDSCIKLSTGTSSFRFRVLKIREALISKLKNKSIKNQEQAVLSSLLLGYTNELDSETRNAFAAAGVMHILSVSGMHVGLVYGFLLMALFFMRNSLKLKVVRLFIVLLGIWVYSLITGFSPPVIRSAAMFTILAAGQALNKDSNNINVLSASALFILICNPFQLADMGFQLSYSAMLGIFLFYRPIYYSYYPSSILVDKIWALVSVSIAAQLGTLPLSLFYFHQFPVYFILTNIIIVPLSGLIIYSGLVMLAFSFWPVVTSGIAYTLNLLLMLLTWLVHYVENMPFANIQGIYLSVFTALLLAVLVGLVALWLNNRNMKTVYTFLICVAVFAMDVTYIYISGINRKVLVVHNIKGHTALSLIDGHNLLLIADSVAVSGVLWSASNLKAFYKIHRTDLFYLDRFEKNRDTSVHNISIHPFAGRNLLIYIGNKKIIIICDHELIKYKSLKSQDADYLILSCKSEISPTMLLNYFKPGQVILSSDWKKSFKFESELVKNFKFSYNLISDNGAYIKEL